MNIPVGKALVYTFAMGAVIFACRAFPFLFFREGKGREREPRIPVDHNPAEPPPAPDRRAGLLNFVEKVVPPAAMTALAFNALAGSVIPWGLPPSAADFLAGLKAGGPALAASALTIILHLWKRNSLLSIFGGTAFFMLLERMILGK